jgi:hypothetical protein
VLDRLIDETSDLVLSQPGMPRVTSPLDVEEREHALPDAGVAA